MVETRTFPLDLCLIAKCPTLSSDQVEAVNKLTAMVRGRKGRLHVASIKKEKELLRLGRKGLSKLFFYLAFVLLFFVTLFWITHVAVGVGAETRRIAASRHTEFDCDTFSAI